MKVKVNPQKVKKEVGIKEIRPLFAKTTIAPIWDGKAFKVTVSLNLFGKILQTLAFPINIFLGGISEAWNDVVDTWKTGFAISYNIENCNKRFEAVKKLYEEKKDNGS